MKEILELKEKLEQKVWDSVASNLYVGNHLDEEHAIIVSVVTFSRYDLVALWYDEEDRQVYGKSLDAYTSEHLDFGHFNCLDIETRIEIEEAVEKAVLAEF